MLGDDGVIDIMTSSGKAPSDYIMLKEWGDLTQIKKKYVSALGPWVWRGTDLGTFEQIAADWADSHVQKMLNISRRRTVIQAGGNMGMYPRLLADWFDTVYTFEPEPLNFFCLANNCQRSNIVKFQGFLADGIGFHGFSFPSYPDANAGEFGMVLNRGYIPSFAVDAFDFEDVDLIWLDVEGSEILALHGAEETIKKCRPVLMIENGDVFAPVKEFMEKMDYKMVDKSIRDCIYVHREEIKE